MYNKHKSESILHNKWVESKVGDIIKWKAKKGDNFDEKVQWITFDLKLVSLTE